MWLKVTSKPILEATSATTIAKGARAGQPSQAKYVLDEGVRDSARDRVVDLLGRFPLYPEIEL